MRRKQSASSHVAWLDHFVARLVVALVHHAVHAGLVAQLELFTALVHCDRHTKHAHVATPTTNPDTTKKSK